MSLCLHSAHFFTGNPQMSPQHLWDIILTTECGLHSFLCELAPVPIPASENYTLCLILLSSNPQLLKVFPPRGLEQTWYPLKDCQMNKYVRPEEP